MEIKTFDFDLETKSGKEDFRHLVRVHRFEGVTPWEVDISDQDGRRWMQSVEAGEAEICLQSLNLGNQYNTTDGRRLHAFCIATSPEFDRHGNVRGHKPRGSGYWLELSEQEETARRETLVFGYCGNGYGDHHPDHRRPDEALMVQGAPFCKGCLQSQYLDRGEVHLLRLLPANRGKETREEETEGERSVLDEHYASGQSRGNAARCNRALSQLREKYAEKVRDREVEFRGKEWLLKRGIPTGNVIYYSHLGHFTIGWHKPIGEEEALALAERLKAFPHEYTIKTKEG